MTRTEFIENVQSWYDLIDFCYGEGCNYCDDVYDDERKDDYFNDDLVEMARDADSWQDMLSNLNDIPEGYDYYIRDDYGDWRGASNDDFDEYKDDVLRWADNHDVWDEEEVDEDEDEEIFDEECSVYEAPEDEDDEELEEGCSLGELFTSCTSKLQTIEIEAEQERKQEEKKFEQFIAAAV